MPLSQMAPHEFNIARHSRHTKKELMSSKNISPFLSLPEYPFITRQGGETYLRQELLLDIKAGSKEIKAD